ncbi:MAG: glutamate--cysteine ligase [Myxococcales bacterium]|nr:glutamate--cysteine ligase [Myxococcales bacterium]
MIVDAATLDVRSIADALIADERGDVEDDVDRGAFAWSNELARHVIEVKTNGPVAKLAGAAEGFAAEIARIEQHLAARGARLLPTAMHPWMDPAREFAIWPHGARAIYDAFDRIFDCRGHGWSNLQSAHLNLPFANDDEFARLHAAARAVLPLLPALAAASPYVEGRASGRLDTRLEVYRTNARRVPSVSGAVVPEPLFTRAAYEAMLEGIYRDLAPLDPEGVLRHEWVNARGCIARFDRMALEIRVLDVQECPLADVAIAAVVSRVVRALCEGGAAQQARLRALDTAALAALLDRATRLGEAAPLDAPDLLAALGLDAGTRTDGDAWRALVARHVADDAELAELHPAIELLCEEGTLASRIVRRVAERGADRDAPPREALRAVYAELADCLRANRMFAASA